MPRVKVCYNFSVSFFSLIVAKPLAHLRVQPNKTPKTKNSNEWVMGAPLLKETLLASDPSAEGGKVG